MNHPELKAYQEEIELAKKKKLLYIIDNGFELQPIISPEGMVICHIIQKNLTKKSNNIVTYNTEDLEFLSSKLYEEYRGYVTYKIKQLNTAGKILSTQEMGLVIFLIYNGNIGKPNALEANNDKIKTIIGKCVQAFELDTSELKVSLLLLDRILPHIQRKLGYLLINEDRKYFIPKENLRILIEKLRIKQKNSSWNIDFQRRWMSFKAEYENQTPTLRALQSYYFSPKHRRLIETIFLKRSLRKDGR